MNKIEQLLGERENCYQWVDESGRFTIAEHNDRLDFWWNDSGSVIVRSFVWNTPQIATRDDAWNEAAALCKIIVDDYTHNFYSGEAHKRMVWA